MILNDNPTTAAQPTVVIVEDDLDVRELTVSVLSRHGWTLLEAGNGLEALSVCEQHSGSVDLLITDVMMPGLDGRELVKRVRQRYPKIRVLYVSGYPASSFNDFTLEPGTAFLNKPFRLAQLLEAVKELLPQ